MNKKLLTAMPFITMPVFLLFYNALDSRFFVEIFGCGCVPSIEANMLGIPFNANDLRSAVFTVLTIGLSVWGMFISKRFHRKIIFRRLRRNNKNRTKQKCEPRIFVFYNEEITNNKDK